jgi:hypothetical protein
VFITESILLSRLLRGKDLSSIELGVNAIKKHDTFLSKMAGYRKADLETYGRAAPNLRLRPTGEHFAEDAFRERLHLDVNVLDELRGLESGWQEVYCYEDGCYEYIEMCA